MPPIVITCQCFNKKRAPLIGTRAREKAYLLLQCVYIGITSDWQKGYTKPKNVV